MGHWPLVIMAGAVANSDTGATVGARRPLVTLCALALLATASVAPAQSQWAGAQVTRAIDGEAIEVKIGDRTEIVRYLGIGTPEISCPHAVPSDPAKRPKPPTPDWRPARTFSSSSTSSVVIVSAACSRTCMPETRS
jgi:hypothetical protein